MIDPNDVAEALWQTAPGKKMFDTWAEVPASSKEIWRGSYDAFVGALNRAGYSVCALASAPSETVGRGEDERQCTCHPDDNPPRPCPRKYALSECRRAAGFLTTTLALLEKEPKP